MHPLFWSVGLFLGCTTAAPASSSEEGGECTPRTLCVDGINTCGVRFGGCYDVCKPEERPIAPLCVSATAVTNTTATATATATVIATPTDTAKHTRTRKRPTGSSRTRRPRPTSKPSKTVTSIPLITTTPPTVSNTAACPDGRQGTGHTVCFDGFNDCGQTYGGCFLDCKPWPTFTPPPCPSVSTTTAAVPIWG